MKAHLSIALLIGVASCNSILGVKDLSGGEESVDGGSDGMGADGDAPTATLRFVLVTPDIFTVEPDAQAKLFANGVELADAPYGQVTLPVEVPLSTPAIQLRAADGETVLGTAALSFDEAPQAGERATVVITGNLQQTDVTALDYIHATGFNEVLLPSGGASYVRVVHAIADRPGDLSYAIALAGDAGNPSPVGPLGSGQNGQQVSPMVELRVRLGQAVSAEPGSEEVSFTVQVANGAKMLLVAAGRQHVAALDRDPGLSLIMVPQSGPASRVRPDPAFFVANFLVDWADENLALTDVATGNQLSGASDVRSAPMLAFLPPGRATLARVDGIPTPYSLTLPASAAGTRTFIVLTGYKSPSGPQPGTGHITIDALDESPNASEATVALVHASPDPSQVSALCHNLINAADYPFGTISFGTYAATTIPLNVAAQFRIFEPGNTTPLRSFNSEIEGARQITVLSGVQTGSTETLRTTNVVMRTWPWEMNAPVVGE